MKKTTILTLIFIAASFVSKAQITSVSYPSGYLSERKITEILENSRKSGTKEWEVQKQSNLLNRQLKKQNSVIEIGTNAQRLISPPQITAAGCNNAGFENGTASGWSFMQGSNSLNQPLPCDTCFTASGGVYEVTSNGGSSLANNNAGNYVLGDMSTQCEGLDCTNEPYTVGIDNLGGFSVVAPGPFGGSHSLLINNSNAGFLMQQASQTFVVDATNAAFTYQYAVVLQDGGHPPTESPYFDVHITDVTTGSVVICSQYNAIASGITAGSIPGWSTSTVDNTVFYKPWTTITLDFSSIISHTVSLLYTVSDCNQGAHIGYAYIDASCNVSSNQITSSKNLCVTGDTTTLSGTSPLGIGTYTWTGPIATATTQTIKTGTPGNYTLTTSSSTGCPAPVMYYNLTQGVFSSLSILATNDSICASANDVLTASGAHTYTWSSNAGTATTNTVSVSPTISTSYTVIGTDSSGCMDTTSKAINVKNCTTGIKQFAGNNQQVKVYPNPNNGSFVIEPQNILYNVHCAVYDVTSKLVLNQTVNGKTIIDASSLNEGVYNISISSSEGVINKRLVIVK